MKFSATITHLSLFFCLALPVTSFKLVLGDELKHSTTDYVDLAQEVTMVARDVDVMLDYFIFTFTDPSSKRHSDLIRHNFGFLHPDEIKEIISMTQKVQEASLNVKSLLLDPGADNAPIDSVAYTSEDGPNPAGHAVLSFDRQNRTISLYPAFYDPARSPAHRAGLIVSVAYKIICGAQDTFMKTGLFGRWEPVGRNNIRGRDKGEYIDTLTMDGFQQLGKQAYYTTIRDAEAWKWLALEFRGFPRFGNMTA
ncbi:hypothetical protein BJ165DRAFT_1457148 [Panaeolus papilionaceus]|nr:hypothetical protein BJ165DRAFT_1457148 [Panaeolus papilionaceus]